MALNSVSFAGWYCLPQSKLDNMSARDCIKLGMDVARFKQKTQDGYSGIYLYINPKREDAFIRSCQKYGVTPIDESIRVK